ncbi:transcriptional regulator [Bacillus sp. AFS018417]|uniref:M56 family metallopeptidase n=1 Tax=Bacillus sp. AFS018417 TaxID=2033491 RepID=UPI000BFA1EAF|nr:M56 family metallopeptidase [Bacillus sp. AFS018417]PEZ08190.1 transcriptional regulator [Bacillus sp. AFS018417]
MIDMFINIYLPRFFDWVIETSMMASILVVVILCVKVLLRNKLTPRWNYLLWMVLIVRLLLPWSPESSYSIYSVLSYSYETAFSVQNHSVVSSENKRTQETMDMSDSKEVAVEERNAFQKSQTTKESQGDAIHSEKKKDKPISFYTISLYIWLTGVIVLSFTTYFINRRLHHYIQKQLAITDEKVNKIFENCKKCMSVQRGIPLLLAGKIVSPTVLGFFRPRLLLSSVHINQLHEQQLRHIFHHELAHIKRRDVGFNWLMYSLLILNWFNPILWYAYFCMREDQELACDALALKSLGEGEQIAYGHTIISLLERFSHYYPVPSLANLSRNKKILKRRIFMIKKFQKKSYGWSALGIAAVVTLSAISLVNADETAHKEKDLKGDANVENVKQVDKQEAAKKEEDTQYTDRDKQNRASNGYIVLNEFYYVKTGEIAPKEQLERQIGKVERIGEWEIKKTGDSNEVPPGPIFSIKGKDPEQFIAAKGVTYENGESKAAYLVFEKKEPVTNEIDETSILSAKNDETEVNIAYKNVKKLLPSMYEYRDNTGTTTLTQVSYAKDLGPGVVLYYRVPSKDTRDEHGNEVQGFIMAYQYDKSKKLEQSWFRTEPVLEPKKFSDGAIRMEKVGEQPAPELIESFVKNDTNWGLYKKYTGQYFLKGEHGNMIYELQLQGDFKPSNAQITANNFKLYQ